MGRTATAVGRWLFFLVFVALTCAPLAHMYWFWFVEQERGRQAESWPTVDGVFVRAGVEGATDSRRHASYTYTVDGRTYEGFREGFAYKEGTPIDVGARIQVYVDPADPTMSVLFPGESDARWPLYVDGGLTVVLLLFAVSRWPVVPRTLSSRQSNALPFTVSFLVMLGACAILGYWVLELQRGQAALSWPTVPGVLEQAGGKQTSEVYRYEVGGRKYRSQRVRFAWGRKHGYATGQEIRVFVNPADPKDAVLYPGRNWSPVIPLFVLFWLVVAAGLTWATWPPWGTGATQWSSSRDDDD
jgi:hypothetical protein